MVHLGLPKRVVREWISRTHSTFDTSNRAVAFLGVCHRSSPLLPLILLLLSLFLSFRFLSFSAVAAATTMRVISAALDADWSLKTAADDEPIFTTCPRRLVFFFVILLFDRHFHCHSRRLPETNGSGAAVGRPPFICIACRPSFLYLSFFFWRRLCEIQSS